MRITKKGLRFNTVGDYLYWIWPWKRNGLPKWYSQGTATHFKKKSEYWKSVGVFEHAALKNQDKVEPFSFPELLTTWVKYTYPNDNLVILLHLVAEAKGISFWSRLPKEKVKDLLNDVVILHCKSKAEVFNMLENIPDSFADAYGFSASQFVGANT